MSDHIKRTTADRVAGIRLDRIDKKNALTADMYQGLANAIRDAENDAQVRVTLLHGEADCFCAGNDLKDFLENPPHCEDSPVFRFLQTISRAEKPIVAAVGGPAIGIGTTMLLHCDLVYATPETRFQLPFVNLGLVPEAGSSLLLPMVAGYQRAAELMLLGQPFDTAKALAAGIVTEVVAGRDLLAHARDKALAIAALPPSSMRMTKALMKKRMAQALAEQIREEGLLFRERLAAPEAKEALTAFFQKRKPDFSGF